MFDAEQHQTGVSMGQKQAAPSSKSKKILENFTSIGLAVFLVLIIRSTIVEPYRIPSGSMIPTLLIGDHIFVSKFAYGWKIPFSEFFLGDPVFFTESRLPERGDIIVFKYPENPEIFYIKRVVALPGDTIQIRDKRIYLNGEMVPTDPLEGEELNAEMAKVDPDRYDLDSLHLFKETHPSTNPIVMHDDRNIFSRDSREWTVPDGHVFCMGDNRDNSSDSRIWGFTPVNYIKGKALVTWLSVWIDFDTGKFIFRPNRLGNVLH